MLKEFRNLMQMLDEVEDEPPSSRPKRPEPAAVELPRSVEPAPPPPAASFILDTDPAHAASLAAILSSSGIESETFAELSPFVRGILTNPPAMVFLEVEGAGDNAIDALFAMGERRYAGGVQLMGADTSPVADVVRRMGERHALRMLPTLRKPLETHAVRDVLRAQNIAVAPLAAASLRDALAENRIEFWYQPKIDLGKRRIAGVETFARVRHPELGTLPPSVFMQGATEADLLKLAQSALAAALGAASHFADLGLNLQFAINVPIRALFELPIVGMIKELGPKSGRWSGLVLDVAAAQLAAEFARIESIGPELAAAGVRLAVDDFGRANLPLGGLRQVPLAELKLDRNFVDGAADDPSRTRICQSVVELAHRLGCRAVAVGIERAADLKALIALGCDFGQGYLFGQPMPEDVLAGLLLKRAVPASEKSGGQAQQAPYESQFVPRKPLPPRESTQATQQPARLRRVVWR